ncbi:MAG: hypothetical protein HYX22_01875 [Candidatus Yanofskybacteria bacterium]|nr:hypothetical protein [Candidatus Yanofskybacteria bacterium]
MAPAPLSRREFVLVLAGFAASCNNFSVPTSNSPIPLNADGSAGIKSPPWSPYIVIHPDQSAFPGYEKAIKLLQSKGMLKGARIEVSTDGGAVSTVNLVSRLGVEVVGLVSNSELFRPDIENMIDQIVWMYPSASYLQIGNELTTIIPKDQFQMSLEQYMVVFKRVFDYVQLRHPRLKLITQSTLGSGEKGPEDLRAMINLGLNKFPRESVFVGINFYDGEMNAYSSIITNDLNLRVFVMESGIENWSQHIGYVQVRYPETATKLRAERIYWYALLDGIGVYTDHSLIKDPQDVLKMTMSPLMKSLTGEF